MPMTFSRTQNIKISALGRPGVVAVAGVHAAEHHEEDFDSSRSLDQYGYDGETSSIRITTYLLQTEAVVL